MIQSCTKLHITQRKIIIVESSRKSNDYDQEDESSQMFTLSFSFDSTYSYFVDEALFRSEALIGVFKSVHRLLGHASQFRKTNTTIEFSVKKYS